MRSNEHESPELSGSERLMCLNWKFRLLLILRFYGKMWWRKFTQQKKSYLNCVISLGNIYNIMLYTTIRVNTDNNHKKMLKIREIKFEMISNSWLWGGLNLGKLYGNKFISLPQKRYPMLGTNSKFVSRRH